MAAAVGEDILDQLADDLKEMGVGVCSYDDMWAALVDFGITPSKSLVKRLCKRLPRCICCRHFVADNLPELKKHIRKEKHFYGQENIRNDEVRFRERLSMHQEDFPGVDLTHVAFGKLSLLSEQMTPGERQSFYSIVHDKYCLVRLTGKHKGL